MSKHNTGGPAFPCMPPQDTAAGVATGYPFPDSGMTLRDYFAGQVLMAQCDGLTSVEVRTRVAGIARICYQMADAMLVERNADA